MDRKEKKERKDKLKEFMDLKRSRFTDYEVEKLESIVNDRDKLNGMSETRYKSYKTYDSEDTYRVNEKSIYTFQNDDSGIRIVEDFEKRYDDGQTETRHITHDTARDILNLLSDIFKK